MSEDINETSSSNKDRWDKVQLFSKAFSLLIIPILLAIITYNLQSTLKQKDVQIRFVELAIKILTENPGNSSKEIRTWAADIIEKHSGSKLGEAKSIIISEKAFPKTWEELGLPNPGNSISIEIENPGAIITANDLCEMRCLNEVKGFYDEPHDYRVFGLASLPAGKYAWTTAGDLKNRERMNLIATGWGPSNIEIHKDKNGIIYVIGYGDIKTIIDKKMELYPERPSNQFSLKAIGIPLSTIVRME